MDQITLTKAFLALSKELITGRLRRNPQRDNQRRWIKYREKSSAGMKQIGGNKKDGAEKKSKCGKTERAARRSTQALAARLPRMLSDSGRLMTGSRGHSESERAAATLRLGRPSH